MKKTIKHTPTMVLLGMILLINANPVFSNEEETVWNDLAGQKHEEEIARLVEKSKLTRTQESGRKIAGSTEAELRENEKWSKEFDAIFEE